MALPFFYLSDYDGTKQFQLDEANSRHAIAVLRMQEGEELLLTDGKGMTLRCRITEAHKKRAGVQVIDSEQETDLRPDVTIAISPVKNLTRFEWFLEKVTEIGIRRIIPMIAHRTEKQQFRQERMQQILISAMLQSQQVWLPELTQPLKYVDLLKLESYSHKWIAHCLETERKSLRSAAASGQSQLLLIGPEGDFSPEEIEQAIHSGFVPVTLGNTRLRTETAGVVGATLLCIN
jgi:16S rRNA (uracil1498-N3)-methyltransferase